MIITDFRPGVQLCFLHYPCDVFFIFVLSLSTGFTYIGKVRQWRVPALQATLFDDDTGAVKIVAQLCAILSDTAEEETMRMIARILENYD